MQIDLRVSLEQKTAGFAKAIYELSFLGLILIYKYWN